MLFRSVNELRSYFKITADDIASGLQDARNPGRLEYFGKYLFDGAHNINGANALVSFLKDCERRSITIIFCAMRGKDVDEITKLLFPICDRIVLTQLENSRSLNYEELLETLPTDSQKQNVFVSDGVANAIDIAEVVTPANGIILVTGSLYLVGEAKKILKSQI